MKSIISESVFFLVLLFIYVLALRRKNREKSPHSSASHLIFPFKQQKLKFITELDLLHTEVQNNGLTKASRDLENSFNFILILLNMHKFTLQVF